MSLFFFLMYFIKICGDLAMCQWYVILAIWESEVGRTAVLGQSGQKVHKTHLIRLARQKVSLCIKNNQR